MCMFPHHMSNPSVSSHANSASTENHLLEGGSPQPFPHHDKHDRVLSNLPTFPPYMKKSVTNGASLKDSVPFLEKWSVLEIKHLERERVFVNSLGQWHRL